MCIRDRISNATFGNAIQFQSGSFTDSRIWFQNVTSGYRFYMSSVPLTNATLSYHNSNITMTSTTYPIYIQSCPSSQASLIDFQNVSMRYYFYYASYIQSNTNLNYKFLNLKTYCTYPYEYGFSWGFSCTSPPCYFDFSSSYLDTKFSYSASNYATSIDISNFTSSTSVTATITYGYNSSIKFRNLTQVNSLQANFNQCINTTLVIQNVSYPSSSTNYPNVNVYWGSVANVAGTQIAEITNSLIPSLTMQPQSSAENIDLLVRDNKFSRMTLSGRLHINASFINNSFIQSSTQSPFDLNNLDCSNTAVTLSGIHDQGCHFKIINNTMALTCLLYTSPSPRDS
eukprot:TRINITY_DN49412_c0_g1_i1.p1 TRINITY_DN49412_c0_g1~~TRINITY_DN49412_c0_g1_i1.p1  ORF type:complete len:342 (+),score=45.16 TRINITY_DN49412_c0_g1_i1:112-1137(+)